MTFLENVFNSLDESYRTLQHSNTDAQNCRDECSKLEVTFLNMLTTDQLEFYSKLEKGLSQLTESVC